MRTFLHAGRAAAAALVCAFSLATWAADADIVAQGEALLRAGRFAEAYQLLEPLEDRLAGDPKYDYLLARSALESNRPSKASFIYERILAVQPNYVGVRMEMGRAYFALGDFARAKLEFETVLRFDNLPQDLRQQTQIYAKAAEDYIAGKKTTGYGYMEYGYGYDSNPKSATSIPVIDLAGGLSFSLPPSQLKQSDHYNALSMGGELNHVLDGGFSLYAGGDARGRRYNNWDYETQSPANAYFTSIDVRSGVGYSAGANNTRIGVNGGRYWQEAEKTRDTKGVTADYRYLVNKQNQFTAGLSGTQIRFIPDTLQVNDYNLTQGSLGWLSAVNEGRSAVGVTFIGGAEKATQGRVDGNKNFYGGRLSVSSAMTGSVGFFMLGGVQSGHYSLVNTAFDLTRRDTLYDITAGVTWTLAPGWSLRPQLVYFRNKSNIQLDQFTRTDFSINVRADF